MRAVGCRGILLAMAYAGAGAHALSIARMNHRTVAQTVLVFKSTFEKIGNDLHVAVGMRGKSLAGRNPVLIDHAKPAAAHEVRIIELNKRKVWRVLSHP